MSPTVVFVAVVALAVVFFVLDHFLRRGRNVPAVRTTTFESAYDQYFAHPEKRAQRDRRAIQNLEQTDPETVESLRSALSDTVEQALEDPNPLTILREAIMDATDRFILVESLYPPETPDGSTTGSDRPADYALSVAEAGVLRCFSMLRFSDYAPEDWYAHYLRVAEMNAKNVAIMVKKTVQGAPSSMETSLHEPLTRRMQEAREALLRHPPRTPVEKSDRLTSGETPMKRAPTQHQIDRLTDIMSERFEQLLSGHLYRDTVGSLVTPAGAFQVDAALLYTQLALEFRDPTDAWRQIMTKSLRQYQEILQSEEDMLEIGKDCRKIWLDSREDGPLNAALAEACRKTFEPAGSSEPIEHQELAAAMREDAARLVGAVKRATSEGP